MKYRTSSVLRISNVLRIAAAGAFGILCACRQDMQDQPKFRPLQPSEFFADGRSARPVPAGTVSRNAPDPDPYSPGDAQRGFAESIPMVVDVAALNRGQERFDIYCTPCHGFLGDGDGIVARRGFKAPVSFHSDRVRQEPPGYIFQVISNGFGAMPDYREQISVGDRWKIVAYIRALELSRNADISMVPASDRARLEGAAR